jgi:hypothetical protein
MNVTYASRAVDSQELPPRFRLRAQGKNAE